MYGTQNHLENNLIINKVKRESSTNQNPFGSKIHKNDLKILQKILFGFLLVIMMSSAFAGSKQPRLAGGNGNAQGR